MDSAKKSVEDGKAKGPDDVDIQIDVVVHRSLALLKLSDPESCRHPDDPDADYELKLRDKAPSITLRLMTRELTELFNRAPLGFLQETYGLDSPNGVERDLYARHKQQKNYKKTVRFLETLGTIPLLKELSDFVGYDNMIPWLCTPEKHDRFYSLLQNKYPDLFKHLKYDETVEELNIALKSGIERRYRTDTIEAYLREEEDAHTIVQKLRGLMNWQMNRSAAHFRKIKGYMPEFDPTGFQRLTVCEIVPKGDEDPVYHRGKSIKTGLWYDMNQEFKLLQGYAFKEQAADIEPRRLQLLKDMYLHTLIARRYIFPQAIDKIIVFETENTDIAPAGIDRKYAYQSFARTSQMLLSQLYNSLDKTPASDNLLED